MTTSPLGSATLLAALGAAAALAAIGCTTPESSPRGHSPWRPVLVGEPVTPAVAVLQGEGGPIEVAVKNTGQVPVIVFEVEPENAVDDGAVVEVEGKGPIAILAPGESAKATVVARPSEAGQGLVRRFRVTYADGRAGPIRSFVAQDSLGATAEGSSAPRGPKESPAPWLRSRAFEVKLDVHPSAQPIEEARSRGKVGSQAPAVYSGTLGAWVFGREDGVVVVPENGDALAWPGVSLRAVAWADLLAGSRVPIAFASEEAHEKFSEGAFQKEGAFEVYDSRERRGEATIEDTAIAQALDFAAKSGLKVDAQMDGHRRLLLVK